MKIKYLCALLLAALIYSCDDSTTGIGTDLIPGGDKIPANTDSYEFTTKSLLADSVYARTSTAYLGRYTDEQFGEFTADFIAQFTCMDNFKFEEELTKVIGVNISLQYGSFFGDSLNAMRLQVDTLDKVIPEKELSTFYTSVDPKDYYNEKGKPIAVKAYSAVGPSTSKDETTTTSSGVKQRTIIQTIKLPNSLGDHIFNKYKENKEYFKTPESFIKNVLKGVYIRCTHGDGTILYIDGLSLNLNFEALIESSSGKRDSLVYKSYFFGATKEVIQANHFSNGSRLEELAQDPDHTYLKSPAGIFTEATFPIAEIYNEHKRDTLNGVNVSFTRYNEKESKYKMGIPQYVLMVRKKDMFSFFEENKIIDNKTSFLSSYSSSNNTYTFTNIAPLITYCIEERKKGITAAGGDPEKEEDGKEWGPGDLEVKDVSFAYPDGKRVLEHVSFSAKPGQIIGVTGPVACGKSTLGKLFLCECPYEGTVRFAGKDLLQMEEAERKGIVAYLGHDPELFHDSVRDNVLLGDEKDLKTYLKAVCIDREVSEMEEGEDTLIGKHSYMSDASLNVLMIKLLVKGK